MLQAVHACDPPFSFTTASISVDFTNVVDQSEQHPLHIYLGFRPQGEVVQAFLYAEIGKHRLDDRQSPGIDLLPSGVSMRAFI